MASVSSLIRKAPSHLAPDLEVAVAAAVAAPQTPSATEDAEATEVATGPDRLLRPRPAADRPRTPGPAPTLAATDPPPAAAATAITDRVVAATKAARLALAPPATRPHQTGTLRLGPDVTGPAPGHPADRTDTRELRGESETDPPDPHPRPTGAAHSPGPQDALSASVSMVGLIFGTSEYDTAE